MTRVTLASLCGLVLVVAGCGSNSASVRLVAHPQAGLLDQKVDIRVVGAPANATVKLSASQYGWTSSGVFKSDSDGQVNLATARSTGGTYRGVAAMGLFWPMKPPRRLQKKAPFDGGALRLSVSLNGRSRKEVVLTRRRLAAGVSSTTQTVADEGFDGQYFSPTPGANRGTPVLIFGGSEGGLSTTLEAGLLASHGYPTLALAYFGAPGLPQTLERVPLEYFARAARWLDRQSGVEPSHLTVYGISRGTEAALELADHFPSLFHAVVAIAPSSNAEPGQAAANEPTNPAAWTLRSKPLAFLGTRAAIPVADIHGPVLLAAGKKDTVAPSYVAEQELAARLRSAKKKVVALAFDEAGHLGPAVPYLPWLTTFTEPSGLPVSLGGTVASNANARARLWPRILQFLGHP